MTRILFIGAPVEGLDNRPDLDYREKFEKTGRNTGNLLIGCSLRAQLNYSSYSFGTDQNMHTLDEEFDLIAIPAANFIFKGFDFGWLADFLSRTKLPCFMVGIGAQLPSTQSNDIEIPEGTLRFLKIVAERTKKIGVRGAFTAEILSKLGIQNVTITGCPSLYSTLKPELPVAKKSFRDDFRISLNGSRNVTQHSYSLEGAMRIESELLKLSLEQGYDYVLQNEFPEIDVLCRDSAALENDITYQLNSIAGKFNLGVDSARFAEKIRKNDKIFFSVESWADYIGTKDFSLGTRFHGNMIALLNGVPAVVLAHDSRTTEMASFMKIPHHSVSTAEIGNLQKVYEEADFETFTRNYTKLYRNYYDFLTENKISHALHPYSSVFEKVPA